MRRGMMSVLVGVALLCAAMLGLAGQAFASSEVPDYNSNCVISAVAKNAVNEDADSSNDIPIAVVAEPEEPGANASAEELAAYEAALAEYDAYRAKVQAAEAGQYINVTLTFPNGLPTVTENNETRVLSATEAEDYLQNNIVFAGERYIGSTANYLRDVSDVVVDSTAKTITFKIGAVQGYTTANYKGTLRIECGNSGSLFYSAMGGAKAETLIQSGVALTCTPDDPDEVSGIVETATVEVTHGALNRGMVHILFLDNGQRLFAGSSTYQNGIITVHAHSFATMQPEEYAAAIVAAANTAAVQSNASYEFTDNGDGTFTIYNDGERCDRITVVMYDGSYLNASSRVVGDIDEPEMNND